MRFSPAGADLALGIRGGYASAAQHVFGEADLWTRHAARPRWGWACTLNQPRDVGVGPVISGAMNSVTALLAGYDFTDPYYATGAELRADRAVGRGAGTARSACGRRSTASAELETDYSLLGGGSHFRPVMPIDEGEFYGATLALRRPVPAEVARGFSLGVSVEAGGDGAGRHPLRPRAPAGRRRVGDARQRRLGADGATGSAGAALGRRAARSSCTCWAGGGRCRGTRFRAYGGDRFAMARADVRGGAVPPLRPRAGVRGGAGGRGRRATLDPFQGGVVRPPLGLRTGSMFSVGAGVGLLFDIIRIDVARGLGEGGVWEVIVEANPSFWDFL